MNHANGLPVADDLNEYIAIPSQKRPDISGGPSVFSLTSSGATDVNTSRPLLPLNARLAFDTFPQVHFGRSFLRDHRLCCRHQSIPQSSNARMQHV